MSNRNPCPYCGAPEIFSDDELPTRCPSCDKMIGDEDYDEE